MFSANSNAQLVVDNVSYTVEDLVYTYWIGAGISGVNNVTYNQGSAAQLPPNVGYFNGVNSNIGLNEGGVLASGSVTAAIGPNDSIIASSIISGAGFDSDLAILSSGLQLYDIASIEFEFIPLGDTLFVNYVFASEEYPAFVGGNYDVFGIFISGPGISGPFSNGAVNMAKIPGTNLDVGINTINNGTNNNGPCVNCTYYINNGTGGLPQSAMPEVVRFNGFTVEMETAIKVECGAVYKIKFAIADAVDEMFDSGLFIKKGSLRTNEAIWNLNAPTVQNTNISICEFAPSPSIIVTSNNYDGSIVTWWFDDDLTQFYQNGDTISAPYFAGNYSLYGVSKLGSCFGDVVLINLVQDFSCLASNSSFINSFSPNRDGVNDTWVIPEITDLNNTVRIFNRWGDLLVQFDGYDNINVVWDGKNGKGKDLPVGTYFYTVELYTEIKTYSGWVQINRD